MGGLRLESLEDRAMLTGFTASVEVIASVTHATLSAACGNTGVLEPYSEINFIQQSLSAYNGLPAGLPTVTDAMVRSKARN